MIRRKMKAPFRTVVTVDAADFPDEVQIWCIDQDISTHYDNSIAWIPNDGNPFAEWLKSNGFKDFKKDTEDNPKGVWIGIFST